MLIKICGITRPADAMHAAQHGATALGFVFWPKSPRYIEPERVAEIAAELPPSIMKVGVFVDEPVDSLLMTIERARLTTVQLHGDEPPAYAEPIPVPVLRALAVEQAAVTVWPRDTPLLLDAVGAASRGGTGRTVDWHRAADIARMRKVILAGGLTPENVAAAIGTVKPFGVDVSSGVEASPGVKDPEKVRRFLANARDAFVRAAAARVASAAGERG